MNIRRAAAAHAALSEYLLTNQERNGSKMHSQLICSNVDVLTDHLAADFICHIAKTIRIGCTSFDGPL